MRLKKILLSLVAISVFAIFAFANVSSYAAETLYLGVTDLHEGGLGYSIYKPDYDGHKIWDIISYDSSTASTYSRADIYCLKDGVGFTDSSGTMSRETYNQSYDMKTARSQASAVVTKSYNEILAALDLFYTPNETGKSAEQKLAEKTALLEAAGIYADDYKYLMTDDDIEAVQQAVLWHFTNDYNCYEKKAWLYYKTSSTGYSSLGGYMGTENDTAVGYRQEQAEYLYDYLVATAKNNAKYYENNNTLGEPITINTTSVSSQEQGDYYILGPINVTKNNNLPFNFEFELKDQNNSTLSYTLLDKDKNAVTKTAKDMINGEDFYVKVSKTNVSKVTINMKASYTSTNLTLWIVNGSNSYQPVVVIEKAPKTISKSFTVTPDVKTFDLALRKYITKVDGNPVTNTRAPVIDTSPLTSGSDTTAKYKHRKDPVVVETGSVVTYNLTVYNEGQKAGYATKIVDQLPEGLTFSNANLTTFNTKYAGKYTATFDSTTNKMTITRSSSYTNSLAAYSSGAPASETVEVECTVKATPDSTNQIILTNVAWIAEEYDSEDNIAITNQTGKDRDSEPSTIPNVNKDNMSNYKGNGNKSDLTDKDYYYKGGQDDDDFEKLVLNPKRFDLALTKKIAAVNGVLVPNRIENIDVSKLNISTGAETTADYTTGNVDKDRNPVAVKKGDLVTYTFTIYNEGEIDGYVQEITEDIPEGLQFLWDAENLATTDKYTDAEKAAIEYNNNMLWGYKEGTNNTQITTDYLSKEKEGSTGKNAGDNLIRAFGSNDGSKTSADLDFRQVSVIFKVISDDVSGKVIRNEACISKDADKDGNSITDRDSDPDEWVKYEDDEDFDNIILKSFDLALRKFIIKVNNKEFVNSEYDNTYSRAPVVDTSKLNTKDSDGNLIKTAIYNHTKEPVTVKKGDLATYMLRVYNEGDIAGYASEIKDHLPSYLEFVECEDNTKYGWTALSDERTVTTNYLASKIVKVPSTNASGELVLNYVDVPITCKVKDTAITGEKITNIADITEYLDENKKPVLDRDSEKNNVTLPEDSKLPGYKDDKTGSYIPGQEDDDDFEKVIIKRFDLALRKFITKIGDEEITSRIPEVKYEDGKISYEHSKDPLLVKNSDIVTYTIRVYNEGQIAGYAREVADDIPDGLEFLPTNDTNKTYRWKMYDKDGNETTDVSKAVRIKTDYLSKAQEESDGANLLNAFDETKGITDSNPDYKEVLVSFKVIEPSSSKKTIINSAQITDDSDENDEEIDDDDSIPDEWNDGEDDQDQEFIKLREFDLALRKFITGVNEGAVTSRIPKLKYENGKISYDHTKDPVDVVTGDIVTYTLRIYNEGEIDGYAKEITDDMPDGLEFLPTNDTNKTYRWKMYDKDGNETTDVSKAVKITTDYLSKEQEEKEYGNLIKAFDPEKDITAENPNFKEVKVAFKVVEPNGSSKILVNSAQISDDSDKDGNEIDDRDSKPGEWNEGEDDQDKEYVKLTYFDLALRKWVTQAIVVENGKQTVTNTGHTPYQNPEPVVKVDLDKKKLTSVTVKFRYSIRVINEGDIAGYAKEVTDYVPEGLKFVAADNPGWTDKGNNVITTRLLENTLLQPGEYADVSVLLTWINNADNLGLKTNVAEISEDYNDKGVKDRDSTPNNKKPGEDDIDDASVILSLKTGTAVLYLSLAFGILVTIAGGMYLIRRYVL